MFFSDLTMEIVRYRLIGPQSHTVLAETLEAATDCDVRIIMLTTSGTPGTCLRLAAENSHFLLV